MRQSTRERSRIVQLKTIRNTGFIFKYLSLAQADAATRNRDWGRGRGYRCLWQLQSKNLNLQETLKILKASHSHSLLSSERSNDQAWAERTKSEIN